MDDLFTTHAADVFGFALRRTSRTAAEDVVSETFLVAWRRLDAVPDSPKPWLLAVARRVLANQRRTAGRQSALTSRLEMRDPDARGGEQLDPAGDEAVLEALAALTPTERDAITLIAWDGLSAEEAAIVLDCSRSAFYVRLHRARKRLAAALASAPAASTERPDERPNQRTTERPNEQGADRS